MLEYICINHGNQCVFFNFKRHKCLRQLFPLHLNTYVMGLRPLEIFVLLVRGSTLRRSTDP